ncbi:MAG: hypothetical protein Q4C13_00335, partial [Clostridia bacterium]|nr:hypothetical protein [Clostridia bacterium]
ASAGAAQPANRDSDRAKASNRAMIPLLVMGMLLSKWVCGCLGCELYTTLIYNILKLRISKNNLKEI